ncbi:glucosyl transferase [Pantoea agglomerans]|uniref:glucosyl transferase n=1 Tax=Enterobacter agglomerans TaxID=549 RepID=UPI003C7B68AC
MNGLSGLEKKLAWVLLFALAFFLIVSRRPDIIFNAQPWAEDGKIWMENIYNNGFWNSLLFPQNGYYQTISRITYGRALLAGLSKAALVANVIAISIRCFFVMFVLSGRMSFIKLPYRIAAVFYFLLMPNLSEGYVNITNVHWYLSLYLMAVVLADEGEGPFWKIHDFTLLIISSLSGPFVVFIAPCLLIKRVSQRGGIVQAIKGINAFDITMAVCCIIQVAAILSSSDAGRSSAPLGASISLLADVISYRVIGGSLFMNELISGMGAMHGLNILLFIALCVLVLICFIRCGWRFKSAALFPVLMIGFALAKPMMSLDQPQWPTLLIPGGGERYFFITNFAFFCLLLFVVNWISPRSLAPLMIISTVALPVLLRGFPIQPMSEVGYRQDINTFDALPSGESMQIRINPPGWSMQLQKK